MGLIPQRRSPPRKRIWCGDAVAVDEANSVPRKTPRIRCHAVVQRNRLLDWLAISLLHQQRHWLPLGPDRRTPLSLVLREICTSIVQRTCRHVYLQSLKEITRLSIIFYLSVNVTLQKDELALSKCELLGGGHHGVRHIVITGTVLPDRYKLNGIVRRKRARC